MLEIVCESPLCGLRSVPSQTRSRLAKNGARLCPTCHDELARELGEIPSIYYQCEQNLVNRRKRIVERIRGGVPGGISLNDAAFTARSDILSVLASWSGLVVDEYPVAAAPRRQVDTLAKFLSAHLDWLTAHPAAGSLAAEIHDVAVKAAAAVEPNPRAQLELGPCAQAGCESTVHVTMRADNFAPAHVSCGAGHVWQPHEWLRLGHWIEQARYARE